MIDIIIFILANEFVTKDNQEVWPAKDWVCAVVHCSHRKRVQKVVQAV